MNHHAPVVIAPTEKALSSIDPHDTRVGSPSPRKLSVVSERIAIATVSVVLAKTIGMTLGSTWRLICRQRPAPRTRALSRYGRSLIDNVWLRMSNAVPGQLVTPITMAMLSSDRPRMLARTMASGRNGMTRNHSVSRNSAAAGHPSKNPDISPSRVPITIEIAVASSPTSSETRAPQMSSVSTDRPLSSVPSGNCADGDSSTSPVAFVTCRPSASASSGAASATRTNAVRMHSPRTPARFARNSCQVRRSEAARRRRVTCLAVSRTPGSWAAAPSCVVTTAPAGRAPRTADANLLADASGYLDVGLASVSPDGRLLAYSVDRAGDEVYRLYFRDLDSGTDLEDEPPRSYYGGAWSAGSDSFFYTVHDSAYRPYQVWRHAVGTPVASDVLVLEEPDRRFELNVRSPRRGDFVVIWSTSRDTSEAWVVDTRDASPRARSAGGRRPGVEYHVEPARIDRSDVLLVVTNDGATEFRLAVAPVPEAGDLDHSSWSDLRPEDPAERLERVDAFAGHAVLSLRSGGRHRLR